VREARDPGREIEDSCIVVYEVRPNEDARWVLVVESGDSLSLAFFSGESEPNVDYHVVNASHYLWGTYSYILPDK
jgi:hypothetical protein